MTKPRIETPEAKADVEQRLAAFKAQRARDRKWMDADTWRLNYDPTWDEIDPPGVGGEPSDR